MKNNYFKLTLLIFLIFPVIKSNAFAPSPDESNIDTLRLESCLKMLSVGLNAISANDSVRQIVYEEVSRCVDDYYHLYFDTLISKMLNKYKVNLNPVMNKYIKEYYNFDRDSDYIAGVFSYLNGEGRPLVPQIAIPHFAAFIDSSELLSLQPQVGWYYFENDWPFHCINCGDDSFIDKRQAHQNITWFLNFGPTPIYYTNGNPFIVITNCTASLPLDPLFRCQTCPSTIPNGPIPNVSAGGSMANYELEIKTGCATYIPPSNDNCLKVKNANNYNTSIDLGNYARLLKVNEYSYYKRLNYTSDYWTIKKIDHPILDKEHFGVGPNNVANHLAGDVLSICKNNSTYFNSWDGQPWGGGSSGNYRYVIGYGLYKLERPGTLQRPLYFFLPYTPGLWYTSANDMRLFFGNSLPGGTCGNGRIPIEEFYETQFCNQCIDGGISYGISTQDATALIANPDEGAMKNYWGDNVITICLASGPSMHTTDNIHDFYASTQPSTNSCTFPSNPNPTLLQTLTLNSSGEYDIQKWLNGVSYQYAIGTSIYIWVKAQFANGEYIDEKQCITVNNVPRGMLKVQIRGNIKDYNSSVTNYEVKVYKQ